MDDANKPRLPANRRTLAVTVTTDYAERCQPYRVRMTCGHEEQRMMRPATAGEPWSPDVVIIAGAPCRVCRGEGA